MNLKETVELLSALKSAGATHFKSSDFEVTLGVSGYQCVSNSAPLGAPVDIKSDVTSSPASSPYNPEATEKVKDLIQTLSMPHDQLIDKIFPNGAGG